MGLRGIPRKQFVKRPRCQARVFTATVVVESDGPYPWDAAVGDCVVEGRGGIVIEHGRVAAAFASGLGWLADGDVLLGSAELGPVAATAAGAVLGLGCHGWALVSWRRAWAKVW
jgi:hypothetical protein